MKNKFTILSLAVALTLLHTVSFANAADSVTFLPTVQSSLEQVYGLHCSSLSKTRLCCSRPNSATNGLTIDETVSKHRTALSISIAGASASASFNYKSEEFIGVMYPVHGSILLKDISEYLAEKVLNQGKCDDFEQSWIMVGTRSWLHATCRGVDGKKASMRAVFKDFHESGSYVKKIIINH